MKDIIRLIVICLVLFSVFVTSCFSDQTPITATEVVEKMDSKYDGDSLTSDTLMVLLDSRNNKRVREIKNIRKDYGDDTKGVIFFLSPADVKNTSYMSFDWDSDEKEDDSWLYLPALKKIKRVASADKSGSFMGSDFTYSDINGMEVDDWDYTFKNENALLEGVEVWVVDGKPKKEKKTKVLDETGYIRTNLWIRKDNFVLVKGKYWVKKGKKIKYYKADEIEKIDGVWTATKLSMVTTRKGKVIHSTLLKVSNIVYNSAVSDNMFTTGSMERGL